MTWKVNERIIHDMAGRLYPVMQTAFGAMRAPTVEQIEVELDLALKALAMHPELERTHGQISLQRSAESSSDYFVSVTIGSMMHLWSEES